MFVKIIFRIFLLCVFLLLFFLGMILVLISPISKYYIEKNDLKYLGREITVGHVHVNPFTGHFHLSDVKIREVKSDSLLLSIKGLSFDLSIRKLFSETYELKEVILDQPKGNIVQTKSNFNFDDIVRIFSSKGPNTGKEPLRLSLLKIKIINGEFHFTQNEIPIKYFIKNVNGESSGYQWNKDTTFVKLSFEAGPNRSSVKADLTFDRKTLDYHYSVQTKKFDFDIANQYLKDLINFGTLRGNADLDLNSTGNFSDKEDATTNGMIIVNDLHLGKDSLEDYVSFKKLVISIKEASTKKRIFLLDSICFTAPYFKFEKYDHLTNLEMMLGKGSVNFTKARADSKKFNLVIELLKYNDLITEAFFKSQYKVNKLVILDGHLKYNDYSLNEKFSVGVTPLYIRADSIDKKNNMVEFFLRSGLAPYGNVSVDLKLDPKKEKDLSVSYHVQKISAALFNPYLISYTSFPMEGGSIEASGKWNVRNGIILSTNHLLITEPRLGKRVKTNGDKWIPMNLLLAMIRERGNVIDYEIPISGNLKHPKFHWGDLILEVLKNTHIRPSSLQNKAKPLIIEKKQVIEWKMRNSSLSDAGKRMVRQIVQFLKKNSSAVVSVYPVTYLEKEKEHILFFEAKKKYFLYANRLTFLNTRDSLKIEKSSNKDPLFIKFLNKQINTKMLFTVQQKCEVYLDPGLIKNKIQTLLTNRKTEFILYFLKDNLMGRIKFHGDKNAIPFNGLSYYKINYN